MLHEQKSYMLGKPDGQTCRVAQGYSLLYCVGLKPHCPQMLQRSQEKDAEVF